MSIVGNVKISIENQERWSTTKSEVLWLIFIMSEGFFHSLWELNLRAKMQSDHFPI